VKIKRVNQRAMAKPHRSVNTKNLSVSAWAYNSNSSEASFPVNAVHHKISVEIVSVSNRKRLFDPFDESIEMVVSKVD
jgi:hypothetical protein